MSEEARQDRIRKPICGEAIRMRNMETSFFSMPLYILDICPEN